MERTGLDYAKAVCKTMMKKWKAEDLPPAGRYHYHQGVFLSGMQKIYGITKDKVYFDYIKAWVDSLVREDGYFPVYEEDELDDYQPSVLLFDLYRETKDEKYKKALDRTAELIKVQRTNRFGGFWHKHPCPNQMWLDGMYMAGPFMTEYGASFDEASFFETVHLQMRLMRQHTTDSRTGLMYHAWDAAGVQNWANPETGCAPEFWGRAMGWFATAMFDIAEKLPEDYDKKLDFADAGISLLDAVLKFQDKETGLWYQVVDKGEVPGNWHEVSCSCLYLHAMCKAIRLGYLNDTYKPLARKAFEGIVSTLGQDGEEILVQKVCIGTGVCTFEEYLNRPTSVNDLHGVGAFLLMCSEYHRAIELGEE